MNANELVNILILHQKWLNYEEGGARADLRDASLYGANLSVADLRGADLRGVDLRGASLRSADLRRADLRGANFREADLCRANLRGANLREADLCRANLRGTDFQGANLLGVNLQGANLLGVNFYKANLQGAKNIPFIPYACPDTGSFIGYKKTNGYIVVLKILSDARRCSATSRKCRCDKAKVLEIQNLDGSKADINSVASGYDSSFIYTVGEIVNEPNFDENRWNECSTGIHFFINRQEAVEY